MDFDNLDRDVLFYDINVDKIYIKWVLWYVKYERYYGSVIIVFNYYEILCSLFFGFKFSKI